MIADLGNLDRSSVPTMVTSIDLATEHPWISVAVAKHRFLSLFPVTRPAYRKSIEAYTILFAYAHCARKLYIA